MTDEATTLTAAHRGAGADDNDDDEDEAMTLTAAHRGAGADGDDDEDEATTLTAN